MASSLIIIRPCPSVLNPSFLNYLCQSKFFSSQVEALVKGAGLPRLSIQNLLKTIGVFPPIPEQNTIVTFLEREVGKIDALITEQQRLIALLTEKCQAVISHAVSKGLNPDVPMKGSGIKWLGEVPEEWEVGALKHYVAKQKGAIKTGPFGSQLTSAEMQEGDVKVYNQKNVIDSDFSIGDNYISEEKFSALSSFEAFPGDLLVTTRGTIGKAAILPCAAEKGILHPCLIRIQTNRTKLRNDFLQLLIQDSHILKTQIELSSNATTIDVIYSETI